MTPTRLTGTLLANGPYARDQAPYRLLDVGGPDAGEFLQRLSTQDVAGLPDGEVRPAALLDAKGKVQATCLVFRAGETFTLECQAEQLERLAELLERYHFTEKLAIAPRAATTCRERIAAAAGGERNAAAPSGDGVVVAFARRGVSFTRVHGGDEPVDGAALSDDLAECLRMCSGLVRVGVETEASTLALEADLDDHCSTTKGCYTGQEIVARIHTYGHVNRKLCLLRLAPGERVTAPQTLLEPDDELPVGRVLHAVPLPEHGLRVGLGYLPKDFQAIGTKLVLEGGAPVDVVGF